MKRYAFLVRGINVGGRHKVVMEEFCRELEELGMSHVSSYINSGNLFFDSTLMKDEILHFGQLGVYWIKYDKSTYSQTAYHKKLLKTHFYPDITIRNARTFSKIGHFLRMK